MWINTKFSFFYQKRQQNELKEITICAKRINLAVNVFLMLRCYFLEPLPFFSIYTKFSVH
jgi:hypothetical protein